MRKQRQSALHMHQMQPLQGGDNHKVAAERHLAKLAKWTSTSKPQLRKSPPVIPFIVIFERDTPVRIIHTPYVMHLPDGRLGAALKKKVYPILKADNYYLVDAQSASTAKSSCNSVSDQSSSTFATSKPIGSILDIDALIDQLPAEADRTFLRRRIDRLQKPIPKPILNERRLADMISKLKKRSQPQLLGIWRNAVKALGSDRNIGFTRGELCIFVGAIETEWSQRNYTEMPSDGYFEWPSTDAPKSKNSIGPFEAQSEGMLSYLEYHVGRTHELSAKVRRAILDRVFRGKLPPVFPEGYMEEWGEPETAHRLRKTAECIAAFARLFKRRDDDRMDQAIREWEADLDWLYSEYYVGHFGFAWPTTRAS